MRKGGSIASDNVVSLVTCDTFNKMNVEATNIAGGCKCKQAKTKSTNKSGKTKRKTVSKTGGSQCDAVNTSYLDSYLLSPLNIVTNMPASTSAIDYSQVQASVLQSLAQQPYNISFVNNITYPNTLNGLNLTA